ACSALSKTTRERARNFSHSSRIRWNTLSSTGWQKQMPLCRQIFVRSTLRERQVAPSAIGLARQLPDLRRSRSTLRARVIRLVRHAADGQQTARILDIAALVCEPLE